MHVDHRTRSRMCDELVNMSIILVSGAGLGPMGWHPVATRPAQVVA